ncbi:MAG: helix-turn-helix domain-containing protein [Chthoniobacterales bacterium]
MKTINTVKKNLTFAQLPSSYQELCMLHLPRPIHDSYDYKVTVMLAGLLAGFEEKMNEDQRDYFDLLSTIIADYESVEVPKLSTKERFKHLLAESGMSASKLASILNLERSVGVRIVNGERNLTLEHVRNLSKYFGLDVGFFI